uniref:MFS transporter n=1 Tax=Novosphingobium sp. TaxID=1874826 RepID=UPI003563F4DB
MANTATLPGPAGPLTGTKLLLAAFAIGMGNFLVVLDTTIANVSVPTIAGALGVSSSQGTWVITSYAVAEAITVPLTGWLSRRFGAQRVFIICYLAFAVLSLLCGLSSSLGMLIGGRVLLGLFGGPIMPLSQMLLLRIFPPEKATLGTVLWAMTTLVGPVAGPILGGIICDSIGWEWIFFIKVPIAIAGGMAV